MIYIQFVLLAVLKYIEELIIHHKL